MPDWLTRDTETEYGTLTIAVSWIAISLMLIQMDSAVTMPNTPVDDRQPVIDLHIRFGMFVTLAFIARAVLWYLSPRQKAPEGMPENAYGLSRALSMSLFLGILVLALIGLFNAWAHDHDVLLFYIIPLPALIPHTYELGLVMGYLHSAAMFWVTFMLPIYIIVGIYHAIRYKVGFLRLIPSPKV